jgi:hypothetical protein
VPLNSISHFHFIVLCSIHRLHFCRDLNWEAFVSLENVVHQLDLMTDLLGTPSLDTVSRVCHSRLMFQMASIDPFATVCSE